MPPNNGKVVIRKIKPGTVVSIQELPGGFVPTKTKTAGVTVQHYGDAIFIPRAVLNQFLKSNKTEVFIKP